MPLTSKNTRWGLGIALGSSLLVWALYGTGMLQRLEWIGYDQRMRLFRAEAPPHPDIAVILIDEASLQAMNPLVGRFPWPRSVYADLLEFLAMGGARAVVFDILFTEDEKETAADGTANPNDQRLINATREAGMVFHAAQIVDEQEDEIGTQGLNRPLPGDFLTRFAVPGARGFPDRKNDSYTLPIPGLYQAARGVGVVGLTPDPDGVYRRADLFTTYQGAVFPGIAVAPLLAGDSPPAVAMTGNTVRVGTRHVPLDREGHFLVNMAGRFQPYSIAGIFASIQKLRAGDVENLLVWPEEFAGKTVFVGASAVGLQDLKATPLSAKSPGVLIHASIAGDLLSGTFLKPVGTPVTLLLTLLLSVVTVFAILGFNRLWVQVALPALAALAYGGWATWAFGRGTVYELAAPASALALSWLATFTYLAFTEARDKRRVRTMLGQYVSPAVLAEVVDRYEDHLQAEIGRSEQLSILFSDVRGFTSISERLQAEQVVDLLNTHFSVMTDVIFRHEGTLDKFIGDAIMAFWGAPIRVSDHALRAVSAALEMHRSLPLVNERLAARGYPAIDIGLGINTGEVILGNIGSEKKLDYTVIGDNVNLASRLEGLTKQYGSPLVISEYTFAGVEGIVPCAVLDLVRVKGKQVPIRIFQPLAHPDEGKAVLAKAWQQAKHTEQAFGHYTARRWDEAAALYEELPDGPLRELYLKRCRDFQNAPPGDDWDGVFTLQSK